MSDDFVLREFTCVKCEHTVVVHPDLPKDYTPNICTPCWESEAPIREAKDRKLVMAMMEFMAVLNKNMVMEFDDGTEMGIVDYVREMECP